MTTKFEKVSEKQYINDTYASSQEYLNIKLPKRATRNSAGYDFYSPAQFKLGPGESTRVATGIRAILPCDKFLLISPRSGLGFKYRLQLDNTVGIIDSDYAQSQNEGHIWIKLTNDSRDGKTLHIIGGEAFAQGLILSYGLTDDDTSTGTRNGGFGSTTVDA